MKKTYRVPSSWQVYAHVEVEAESWEEAIAKVESNSVPLPTDPNYVCLLYTSPSPRDRG